ncbi:MAG: DUF4157 domain-containing protein [Kofleriaceae bacterium]
MWDRQRIAEEELEQDDLEAGPLPGKRTLTARMRARPHPAAPADAPAPAAPVEASRSTSVQADGRRPGVEDDPFAIHLLASQGVAGAGGPLPHLAAIQASFGHHDVSAVRAHVGGQAADAARAIGAAAYATGDAVAFAASPDLRQAAHEAAHVVQQRGGVRLDGGVGQAGDPYEQHADAVAERVVRGERAEALLDAMADRGAGGGPAVQRDDRNHDGIDDDRRTKLGGAVWMREGTGPGAPLTDTAVATLRRRVLEAAPHATSTATDSFERVRRWDDDRINRALRLLADLDHGTDPTRRGGERRGRRGGMHRPGRAWAAGLDDLGTPDRTGATPEATAAARSHEYQNILEFADRIDRLSESTMGVGYNPSGTAGGMDLMPTVRLAGASVGVHPRGLWFAAAAQAAMDRGAGRAEGGGHYIPVGGFRAMLLDIDGMAERLGTEAAPRRGRGAAPSRRDRAAPLAGGDAIYAVLVRELVQALEVLEHQASGDDDGAPRGYRHDEHREPELRRFVVAHAADIRALPATCAEADVPANARAITAILAGLPGARTRRHGAGSVDPHGTEHAMGLAVDIYNGAGPGGNRTNFAIPDDYDPFVQRLIAHHGASVGLAPTLRPESWSDLDPTGDQATTARRIAQLIREHGTAEADAIAAEAAPSASEARADTQTASRYTALRNRARNALRDRRQALTRAGRDRHLDWTMANDVQREIEAIDVDLARIEGVPHHELVMLLQRHYQALARLEAHDDADGEVGPPPPDPHPRGHRRPPADPLATVGPDDARRAALDLGPLIREIEAMGTEVDAAVARHDTTSLSELVTTRPFRTWLATVSDVDRPAYDQPTTMVEGFDDVAGTHFYGGHHWEIAPLPEETPGADTPSLPGAPATSLLDSEEGYRRALDADLHAVTAPPARARPARDAAQVERILDVMAESAGGRRAIFGTSEIRPGASDPGPAMCGPDAPATDAATGPGASSPTTAPTSSSPAPTGASPTSAAGSAATPAGADPTLLAALNAHLGDVTPILQRVHDRVVAPYAGGRGETAAMLRDLRDRGFYVTPPATP